MKTLAAKFTRLKRQVGGNREKYGYEETFGQPKEEFFGVTMPNSWNRRILSELEFSIRLSKELSGQFDSHVEEALNYLLNEMEQEGALTIAGCKEAERLLMPLSEAAKKYELILAAHAHIDMNWMWGWQETVSATVSTFQTMLKLMEEYPDFHFSQSQASVYKIIEDYAPELKEEIQQRIREGRWEVTASAWVETDKNMPSTESILNHIYYTKKYLQEHWDIDPASLNIDFSPDTFGHSAHLAELDQLGGVKYYYHCRGLDGENALYRWRAPSGKELLVYREQYWYNSGITPLPGIGIIETAKHSGGLKTGLVVYGVGNHGGGPTRRDIERALEMMEWPVFPKLRFGTFAEYFQAAESVRDQVPVIDHELNFIFPGCYTTQSRIKLGNRRSEAALYEAQCLDALAGTRGKTTYQTKQYEDAWQSVLFTHFHDILTGSCVQETREHAMGLFAHALGIAGTRASFAMQKLAQNIDTSAIPTDSWELPIQSRKESQSEGAGAGYGITALQGMPVPERGAGVTRIFHLFNATSMDRQDNCTLTVWDYTGDLRYIYFEDIEGKELPFQLLDKEHKTYWDHKYFRVLVKAEVPGFGYNTIVLRQREPEEYQIYLQPAKRTNQPTDNIILENEALRAEFDFRDGYLISLMDKTTGLEQLREKEKGGLRFQTTERSSSNAWQIGRYTDLDSERFQTIKITKEDGELRSGFRAEYKIKNSNVKTEIYLEKGARTLIVHMEVDWHEISREGEPVPVLLYHLPLTGERQFLYDIPGGVSYREAMQLDVPGLTYGAALCKKVHRSVVLSADSKYGYRGNSDGLSCTLINSTYSPDPYPERGIHNITLHVGVATDSPVELERLVLTLVHPILFQSGSVHAGTMPLSDRFLSVTEGEGVISGIFRQDGHLILRLSEISGQNTEMRISLSKAPSKAEFVNLFGKAVEGQISINENVLTLLLPAYSTRMVRVIE